jgi:hypothetical protein
MIIIPLSGCSQDNENNEHNVFKSNTEVIAKETTVVESNHEIKEQDKPLTSEIQSVFRTYNTWTGPNLYTQVRYTRWLENRKIPYI